MSNDSHVQPPSGGYITDHTVDGRQRKCVKFIAGSFACYEHYDIVVEGNTYQNPERIDKELLILVPADVDVAYNSRIGVYGANGAEASKKLFQGGDAVRPFGGRVDNTGSLTRVIFEGGNIGRYANYSAEVSGKEYGGIKIIPESNAVELPLKVDENVQVIVYGHNDADKKITVFDGLAEALPVHGFVVFHGSTSTCVMFQKGDMTKYSAGYKLSYEDGKSTTEFIGLEPIHIRFESVGKNIRTEVKLHSLKPDGSEDRLLFQGRYNDDEHFRAEHS
ncbi:hypothetical protein [Burkholderia gladioli]|uniref:hypothetical protein n=1 Tax=Burkholderia gladioli TaxID=28095 RepID=UPI0019176C22|nr:hypothetical protein [Burkholderia gladioli]